MEKQFIPYELALKLKELGFDEQCFAYYNHFTKKLIIEETFGNLEGHYKYRITAPLWQQAFDWFRDKYNINGYYYQPNETDYWAHSLEHKAKYDSYEEARQVCLEKLIEIVETK